MPADMNDFFKKKNDEKKPDFIKDIGKKATYIYIVIAVVVLLIIAKPYTIINSGEVGIKVTAGKFEPIALAPGIHFFIPGIQKIIKVDTRVRVIKYGAQNKTEMLLGNSGIINEPAIEVLDARGLPIGISLTVQYRLNPNEAPETIATWGAAWEEKIINSVVREVVKNVIGEYKAEDIPLKRNEIAKLMESQIRSQISAIKHKPVDLVAVQLRNISLPTKIKEQIERVQIAKQQAQRVKYEVEMAKQQAQKQAALAKGEAEAKKIKAEGEAQRILIEAKAKAQANLVIGKSLTPELLKLREIEVQSRFNEALKVNKNAKIFLTPGGVVPNLWINSQDNKKASLISK